MTKDEFKHWCITEKRFFEHREIIKRRPHYYTEVSEQVRVFDSGLADLLKKEADLREQLSKSLDQRRDYLKSRMG